MNKWAIARPREGISLNGREYVAENGKVKLYDSYELARIDLMFHGYNDADIEREGIDIVRYDSNEDGE